MKMKVSGCDVLPGVCCGVVRRVNLGSMMKRIEIMIKDN